MSSWDSMIRDIKRESLLKVLSKYLGIIDWVSSLSPEGIWHVKHERISQVIPSHQEITWNTLAFPLWVKSTGDDHLMMMLRSGRMMVKKGRNGGREEPNDSRWEEEMRWRYAHHSVSTFFRSSFSFLPHDHQEDHEMSPFLSDSHPFVSGME